MNKSTHINGTRAVGPTSDELQEVAEALRGLRYGVVQVVVQDGVVVQIDRTEKRRLRNPKPTDKSVE